MVKKLLAYSGYLRAFSRDLIIVTDGAGWVIDNVSHNMNRSLKDAGIRSCVINNRLLRFLKSFRNKTFFFIDRWACLDADKKELFETVSRHNRIILTWWHSAADGKNTELSQSVDTLKEMLPYLAIIHVPCTQEYDFLIKHGIDQDMIKTVPEGIEKFLKPLIPEEKSFFRKKLNIPENAFCIGLFQKDGVGWEDGNTPKREKGPDIFIETVNRLVKKYSNIFVVLTGPSRGYVKQELKKLNIPYIHEYLKDYKEIINYYGILDLYLITSRTEGGPKSVLEAMSCGIPVVSTKVGMCSDIIEDNHNGFLCDVEDVGQLCEKAERLILSEGLRRKFSKNGLETVKNYSWDKVARLIIDKCIKTN